MKFVFIGLVLLFGFSSINGVLNGKEVLNQNAIIFVVFLLFAIGYSVFKRKNAVFDDWLNENRNEVLQKGLSYKGVVINKETKLTRFNIIISLVALSLNIPSRLYIVGHDKPSVVGIIYGVFSGIFGWWGIPWGPIWTIEALAKNFSGGEIISVNDYFNPIEKEPFDLFSKSGLTLVVFMLLVIVLVAIISVNVTV